MGRWIFLILIAAFFSCTPDKKAAEEYSSYNQNDTMELIRGFIYGLWSLDSDNNLNNDGLYFKSDGSVDFVASENSGNWFLSSKDSIKIDYSLWRGDYHLKYRIDSLSSERMVLTDSNGTYPYRKVPFGINNEGNVLQGFAGNIYPGEEREYILNLPSTKKITLKLSSSDSTITFRMYDGNNELTSSPLHSWSGIIIRSGKYRAVVSRRKDGVEKGDGGFDFKVIAY